MKELNPELVKVVSEALKGKKLEIFQSCVAIINESLALGGWTKRGSVKSTKGFSQGIINHLSLNYECLRKYNPTTGEMEDTTESITLDKARDLSRSLCSGIPASGFTLEEVESICNHINEKAVNNHGEKLKIKQPPKPAKKNRKSGFFKGLPGRYRSESPGGAPHDTEVV